MGIDTGVVVRVCATPDTLAVFQKETKKLDVLIETVKIDWADYIFEDEAYEAIAANLLKTPRPFTLRADLTVALPYPVPEGALQEEAKRLVNAGVKLVPAIMQLRADIAVYSSSVNKACESREEVAEETKRANTVYQTLWERANQLACDSRKTAIDFRLNVCQALPALSDEAQARYEAEHTAQLEAAEEKAKQAKEQRQVEMLEWATHQGSGKLIASLMAGYPSKRAYIEERTLDAAEGLSVDGAYVDWSDDGGTDDKASPSLEALQLADEAAKVFEAPTRVVYTNKFWVDDEWGDENPKCEAVRVIQPFGFDKDVYLIP